MTYQTPLQVHLESGCDQGICATEFKDVFLVCDANGVDLFRVTRENLFVPGFCVSYKCESLTQLSACDLKGISGEIDFLGELFEMLNFELKKQGAEFYADLFAEETHYPISKIQ